MTLYLSNSDYLRNIEGFLSRFDPSDPDELTIRTHPRWVNVHPAILTMAASLASRINPDRITIEEVTATSGHYLDRMGLYDVLGLPSPFDITKHEPAGRFIPLTRIRNQDEQSKFITDMIPLLHLAPNQSDAIKYVIGELVRNVIEHAESESGAIVAAQYYSKSNTVRLGISDSGIGVRKSISRSWYAETDIDGILLALTPGITGTTRREGGTDTNAGAGLFFIKSMSMVSRDYFVLYSGSGLFKLNKRDKRIKGFPTLHSDPLRDKHTKTNSAPPLPGTTVAVDLSLDQTQEFRDLLSAVRTVYTDAVRQRKKERFKKPRFE